MLSSNAIRRAARTIVWNCTATRRGTSSPVCEALESRKLLTQHLYEVPFGHSVAYIQPKEFGDAGQLQIRLDSLSNPPVYPFDNTQGMDVINAGLNPGFVFVDQVPAALKPRFDIDGDAGILVQAGSGATLRIEAPVGDDDIRVIESSATTTTVLTFSDDGQNFSRLGAGVSNLTLRTSDFPAQNFFPGGGTNVTVPFLATDVHLRVETGLGTFDQIFLGQNNSIAEEVVVKTGAGNCIVNLQGGNGDDQTTARVDFGSGPLDPEEGDGDG